MSKKSSLNGKRSNPLSYLGWLGVLGILGIFFVPVFIPFLLFFTFFSYRSVIPDELFWRNVNRASARAFWAVFTLDVAVGIVMFIRGMTLSGADGWIQTDIQREIISMGTFTYAQYMIAFLTLFGSITLMILVFSISMMRFRKQEKKMLEES